MSGSLLIIIASVLWALDGVLRRSLYTLPAITIVLFEHLVGLLFLLPFLPRSFSHFSRLRNQDKAWMMWIALFSSVLGTLWFTSALLAVNFIPFSVVFLLQKLQPIFVIAAARFFLHEKIKRGYWLWAGVALIAAYFVTFPNGSVNFSTGDGTRSGALYALAAAFAWGTSTVFSRRMLLKLPDITVTTLRFFFASIFALGMVFFLGQQASLGSVQTTQVLRFVLIALSTGMFALHLYYKGLAKVNASLATILELVFPLTAVVIDVYAYDTVLAPVQYIGALFLVISAYRLAKLSSGDVRCITTKVRGKGRGKLLGFPTINLRIPPSLDTQDGIYAVRVSIGEKTYKGALHYGPIPTFADAKRHMEVFLLDTTAREVPNTLLEKSKITVEFVRWLRPVLKFDSQQELIAAIEKDVVQTRQILE